jgi:hypothetical protein
VRSAKLGTLCKVYNGAKPFEKGKGMPPQTEKTMKDKPFVRFGSRPSDEWSPLLRGSLINRYRTLWQEDYWILYGPCLAAPRKAFIFDAPIKIMVRQTGDSIIATLVEGGIVARDNLHILLPSDENYDMRYFLGLMNSKLMNFAYTYINPEKGEALAQVKKKHVEELPIRVIDFCEPNDKFRHDKMVSLVERMLDLHKQLGGARVADEKRMVERQIEAVDGQIDRLVYELYELTEEEIGIVEGK